MSKYYCILKMLLCKYKRLIWGIRTYYARALAVYSLAALFWQQTFLNAWEISVTHKRKSCGWCKARPFQWVFQFHLMHCFYFVCKPVITNGYITQASVWCFICLCQKDTDATLDKCIVILPFQSLWSDTNPLKAFLSLGHIKDCFLCFLLFVCLLLISVQLAFTLSPFQMSIEVQI